MGFENCVSIYEKDITVVLHTFLTVETEEKAGLITPQMLNREEQMHAIQMIEKVPALKSFLASLVPSTMTLTEFW